MSGFNPERRTIPEKRKVLIVDDEPQIRDSLQLILNDLYQVSLAENGSEALEALGVISETANEGDYPKATPDLVLLDVMMPGVDGIEILKQIKSLHPTLPVIMVSASKQVKTAVQAMKLGAVDYLNKPFEIDEMLGLIRETFLRPSDTEQVSSERERVLKQSAILEGDFGSLVGQHPVMSEMYHKVGQLAKRDTTVLVTGESGTGKELIAKEIHKRSSRAQAPFVALNCAAIPETLIESELFGHEKGAFTHAVERRLGHFELADKGTLFLDEIGELSLPVQVKMLRFLQDQEFYRVGRPKPIRVDVRIIAATNRSLETAIQEGKFRQDLFYRINVVNLEMPPLRSRKEDIPNLVQFFLKKLSPLYGDRCVSCHEDFMEALDNYSWPGNVRELENVIESVLALSQGEVLRQSDLPARIKIGSQSPGGDAAVEGALAFDAAERAFEMDLIVKALERTNYVQTRAAELLGISRRILKYKMDKLGIRDKPPSDKEAN